MSWCTVALGLRPDARVPSGHPQHLGVIVLTVAQKGMKWLYIGHEYSWEKERQEIIIMMVILSLVQEEIRDDIIMGESFQDYC